MHESINTLIGHPSIKSRFKVLLQKDIFSRTLLFEGPAGVGKAVFAKAFALALLKEHGEIDLHEYFPEGKTNMHSMSRIQELIKKTKLPSFKSSRKVFIIYEAERMLASSSNALLKTLEEPLDHVIIILVSSHSERILQTILSRALSVKFSYLTSEDIALYFQEKKGFTPEKARQLSLLSNGTLLKADLLAKGESEIFLDAIINSGICAQHKELLALEKNLKQIEKTFERIEGQARVDFICDLFNSILYFYRDLHLLKLNGNEKLLFYHNKKEELKSCLTCSLPSLEEVIKKIDSSRAAIDLSLPLSQVLNSLFMY